MIKTKALKIVEEELKKAEDELDSIPIVQEFKEIQIVVNDVLQLVSGTIAREVTNHVIEATGGDVLTGKTGSKVNNKSNISALANSGLNYFMIKILMSEIQYG